MQQIDELGELNISQQQTSAGLKDKLKMTHV